MLRVATPWLPVNWKSMGVRFWITNWYPICCLPRSVPWFVRVTFGIYRLKTPITPDDGSPVLSLFIFILVVIHLSTQMWNLDMKIVYLIYVVISLEISNCCLIHHGMNGLCTYSCRTYTSKKLLSLLLTLNFDHIFPHLWNSYSYEG